VGIEIRDVPRWSYLAAVVPDLGARLDQLDVEYGLDDLLKIEREVDEIRDGLAELVMGAADPGARAALAEKFSPDMIAAAAVEPSGEPPWPAGLRWMSGKVRGPLGSYFPHYSMGLQALLPPGLGRTRADQIAALASMIDSPLPLDCEGALGAYHPVNHQIILFPWMIELTATVMGWSAATLERVAILHEVSHAMLIDGTGAAGKGWETYDRTPERVHEILACMLTEATARRLGAVSEAQLAGTITELATPEAGLLADFPGGPASLVGMVREGWFDGVSDAVLAMARRVVAERCQTTAASTHLLVRMNDLDPWERTILHAAIAQCLVAGPAPAKGSAVRLEIQMVRKALQDQRMSAIPRTGEWVFPRIADDPAFLRVQALLEGGDITHTVSARSSK
jgi:hypothetical protein